MNKKTDQDTLFCSFCAKSQREVKKLIAGNTVYICDGCVELCNEIIQEELNDLKKLVIKECGEDLVPSDYPEPFNERWNEIYGRKKWQSDYPFDKRNVENFAKFCLQSGGFEIC